MSKNINFVCPKCGNTTYDLGEIHTTGGFISKVLDVQNKKFTHVTCKRCKYTEFYQAIAACSGTFSICSHKIEANRGVFSARVSLREHEVLFAALKRTELLII